MGAIEERITARIEQLKKELEDVIIKSNQTIAAYQGAIGELTKLLEPVEAPPNPPISKRNGGESEGTPTPIQEDGGESESTPAPIQEDGGEEKEETYGNR